MKALDLFCGAGGASLGLHRAGFDVVGYDHWQPAVDTHNANGLPAGMLDLSVDDPPHPGAAPWLMWASPPCQPFSAAGDGAGEFDDRDGFPWLLRIVGNLRPDVLIVENVKGLTFEKHREYLNGVLLALRDLGYDLDYRVLNCADYGVPQTRERCIIVARRDGGPIAWPAPTHTEHEGMFTARWVTMADALGWGGELAYRRGAGNIERHGPRGPWDTTAIPAPTVPRNSEKDWLLSPGAHADLGGNRRTYDPGVEPAPTVHLGNDAARWRWVLNYRQTDRDGVPITCDVTDRPSPTIGAKSESQWQIGPDAIRLTIAELAALQGFPADWKWCGTKTAQARQIGNAVPPALAEAVAGVNRPVPKPNTV